MDAYSQVISKQAIEILLEKHGLSDMDFYAQLKSGAFLYQLTSDIFIVYETSENFGLLVKGKAAIEKMVNEDYFPIELEPKNGQPIEYDKDNIQHINERSMYYRDLLNNKTGLKFDTVTENALKEYLTKSFVLSKKNKLGNDGKLALTSVIGEYAIMKYNGKWALRKVYHSGYNPSFEPCVIKSNQKLFFVYSSVIGFLNEPTPIAETFIQRYFISKDSFMADYKKNIDLIILD